MIDSIDTLLANVVAELGQVPGVTAVVLGGSRARGTHTAESDVDLGIYYTAAEQFDTDALGRLAARLDDRHQDGLVTGVGGWGPRINGGGWLTVRGWHVDFLYRDLRRVEAIIGDSCEGRFEMDYQPGHPQGFPSYIYMGEVAVCRPLWDPAGAVADLKERTVPYPAGLRRAIVDRFLWEADFSLQNAAKAVGRSDAAYVAGCCFRCVMCMTQCLFAANGEYWLNEKGSVAMASRFALAPARYGERVQAAFGHLGADPGTLAGTIAELRGLAEEAGRVL